MQDIVEYHLIRIIPECFLGVNKQLRNVAISTLMTRRFARADCAFWRTLGIIARANDDLGREFIVQNYEVVKTQPDANDRCILNTYSVDESNYIIKQLLSIMREFGADTIHETARYFTWIFSIWYAHEIVIRRTSGEIKDLIEATLRHFPGVIPRYLRAMCSTYSGNWPMHHDIMIPAIDAIEQRYPDLEDKFVLNKLKSRIRKNINTAKHNAAKLSPNR